MTEMAFNLRFLRNIKLSIWFAVASKSLSYKIIWGDSVLKKIKRISNFPNPFPFIFNLFQLSQTTSIFI